MCPQQGATNLLEVACQLPYDWHELDEAIEVEGIALTEGTFSSKDNKVIHYSSDVIRQAVDTLIGVPLCVEGHDGIPAGFVTGAKIEDSSALFKALVLKPSAFNLVKENKPLSMEALVKTTFNPSLGVDEAKEIKFEAICLLPESSLPACKECKILEVRKVELEDSTLNRGEKMEKEEIGIEDLLASLPEDVRLQYPRGFDAEKFKKMCTGIGVDPGKCETLANILTGKWKYPIPGYPYYPAKAEETEMQRKLTEYNKFMSDCIKGGKTFAECAREWKAKKMSLTAEIDALLDELSKIEEEKIQAKYEAEIKPLLESVKQKIPDFCDDCLKTLDFESQKVLLESLDKAISAPPVKLSVSDDKKLAAVDKASKELFGVSYEEVLKEVTRTE